MLPTLKKGYTPKTPVLLDIRVRVRPLDHYYLKYLLDLLSKFIVDIKTASQDRCSIVVRQQKHGQVVFDTLSELYVTPVFSFHFSQDPTSTVFRHFAGSNYVWSEKHGHPWLLPCFNELVRHRFYVCYRTGIKSTFWRTYFWFIPRDLDSTFPRPYSISGLSTCFGRLASKDWTKHYFASLR